MRYTTRLKLDGDWTLRYIDSSSLDGEYTTVAALDKSPMKSVPAAVPGNFELDMLRARIIGDPFYSTNTIDFQRFESLHLFYSREFTLDREPDENTFIVFEGIDTVADIFINGELLGHADNMLIPHEFSAERLRKGRNGIVVHIFPAALEARKYELPVSSLHQRTGYDSLYIRKAAHMYGWDIMPRLMSGGIWRSVFVEQRPADRIDDLFVWTHDADASKKTGTFGFFWNLTVSEDEIRDYSLRIEGKCRESEFAFEQKRLWHTAGRRTVALNDAKLWFPKNYGQPDLYEITATLLYKGEPVHEKRLSVGLRTIELIRSSVTDGEKCGFQFVINRQPVFVLGTNWSPLDALHSRDTLRMPSILEALDDLGCNMVRVWGGGVYEPDEFYDFCDKHGIMVWQDLAHGCGLNPQTDDYAERFEVEVESVVKRLRGHTSLVLWAGDNEVDECFGWHGGYLKRDPNKNRLTREVIPKVLNAHDFTRPYLPSSPYIDESAFSELRGLENGVKTVPERHLWGPRDYFKREFYKDARCSFVSEIGWYSCPSPELIRKYWRPDRVWCWNIPGSDTPNDDWACHASASALGGEDPYADRIKGMSTRVTTIFREFAGHEAELGLERFAMASQIAQAEADKYFIERFRVKRPRTSGIIWWNLTDGWAGCSGAVIDYLGNKKLAYHYIKRSQASLCLIFDEPTGGILPLCAVSDLQTDVSLDYRLTDLVTGEVISASALAKANSSAKLLELPAGQKRFYLIEWRYGGVTHKNHYCTNVGELDLAEYLGWLKRAGFDEFEGF